MPPGLRAQPVPGTLDVNFTSPVLTAEASGNRVRVLNGDRIYVCGINSFISRNNGVPTGVLVEFNPDGTFARGFPALAIYDRATDVADAGNGRLLVAVGFTDRLTGKSSYRVVRLNADGTLDTGFDAGDGAPFDGGAVQDNAIRSLAVQPDGKVLVGGSFGDFNRTGRSILLRLNANGSVDGSFAKLKFATTNGVAPNTFTRVGARILVQPDNKILIGGRFSAINGVELPGVARLNSNGTPDAGFNPSGFRVVAPREGTAPARSRREVRGLALYPDGRILVSGAFIVPADFDANPTGGRFDFVPVLRLQADGQVDESFGYFAGLPNPAGGAASTSVLNAEIRLLTDGRSLLAGALSIYRLTTNGEVDSTFSSPSIVDLQTAVAPSQLAVDTQADGRIVFASGVFSSITVNGAGPFDGVARLTPDGALDSSFNLNRLQEELSPAQIAVRKDGSIVVGGGFNQVNNGPQGEPIALLNADGTVSAAFTPPALFGPYRLTSQEDRFALQTDDKLIVFGTPKEFNPITGEPSFTYARLNSNGSLDGSFSADANVGAFAFALVQPDGKIVVSAGDSLQSVVNGDAIFARLNTNGSRDSTFANTFGGVARDKLVQRDGTGSIESVAVGDNRCLAVQPDGLALVQVYTFAGYQLLRLKADGTTDPDFAAGSLGTDPSPAQSFPQIFDPQNQAFVQPSNGTNESSTRGVAAAFVQEDGRILLVGQFASYNGKPAGSIVRLLANGKPDPSFRPGKGARFTTRANYGFGTGILLNRIPTISSVVALDDGSVLIAGDFQSYNGVPVPGIAHLNVDGLLDAGYQPPLEFRATGAPFFGEALLARALDGGVLVAGGAFAAAGSPQATARPSILRLFNPSAGPAPDIQARVVAVKGAQVPAEEEGVLYRQFAPPSFGPFTGMMTAGKKRIPALFASDGRVLLQIGDGVPRLDGATLSKVGQASGDAMLATIKGAAPDVTAKNNEVLIAGLASGNLRLAARKGAELDGLPGVSIKSFGTIDGNGSVIFFLAKLQGADVTAKNDAVLCAALADGQVRVLVREGQAVGATAVSIIGTLVGAKGTLAEGRWRAEDAAIGVRLTFADGSNGLYTVSASAQSPADWKVWSIDSEMLGAPLEGLGLESFGLPAFGPDGVAWVATLAGESAGLTEHNDGVLLRADAAGLTLLARENAQAPGLETGTFKSFGAPVSGAGGSVAFAATLAGVARPTASTIWHAPNGQNLRLLARTGGPAPGGGRWAAFTSLALPDGAGNGPLFTGKLAGDKSARINNKNNIGLWGVGADGTLKLVLRTGQTVSIGGSPKTLRSFQALVPGARSIGAARGYNNAGLITIVAKFTDKTTAVLELVLP